MKPDSARTPQQLWMDHVREEAEIIAMTKGWDYRDAIAEAKRRVPRPSTTTTIERGCGLCTG